MQTPLLCGKCEDRFNENGEDYVLKWLTPKRKTPRILSRLRLAVPLPGSGTTDLLVYSAPAVGVDTTKFAYFALSILWRGSIRRWRTNNGELTEQLHLGGYAEPIRRYLLGEAGFPPHMITVLTVCSDPYSIGTLRTPTNPVLTNPLPYFAFQARGVLFGITMGVHPLNPLRQLCCVGFPEHGISMQRCDDKTIAEFATLRATATPVGRAKTLFT